MSLRLAIVYLLLMPMTALADEPKTLEAAPSDLSMEVSALLTLHRFEFTPSQLAALRRLVPDPGPKAASREPGKASEKYLQLLADLRSALITEKRDDDLISDLEDRMIDLHNAEEPDLDDDVEITDLARRRAPDLLRAFSVRQVAAYLNDLGEALPDPLERLLEALDKAPQVKDAEWKDLSEEITEQVGWLLAGLDKKKTRLVEDKVSKWLVLLRSLKDKDFQKHRADQEKSARLFVAQVLPTAVLHNIAEHALAELLANPRLGAAIDARLKR